MSWNYFLFELRLLMSTKKNWLLGVALISFFPLYYLHYGGTEIKDQQQIKNEEAQLYSSVFNYLTEELLETPEGEEIYNNLTQQASLVNAQRFVLWKGDADNVEFIDSGLQLNELRLRIHELGNEGIPDFYVIPKAEIYKESALLSYYKEHDLSLVSNPFVASTYLPDALKVISGLLFSLFVLLIGSNMYLHDHQKRTVMGVFPVTFMQKVISKVSIHFLQTLIFLVIGVLVGGLFVSSKTGWGNFKAPVLLFEDGGFLAISTTRYLVYMFIALALIALLLLFSTALMNILTKNVYVSILTILLVLAIPTILNFAGFPTNWLRAIHFIDISSIMTGETALGMKSDTLDYKHAISWLVGLNVFLLSVLYVKNKLTYRGQVRVSAVEGGVDTE